MEKLPAPASLGPYAVYVLWALTPDGRAVNQGVIVGAEGGKGKMSTQYGASQFALIVTAEPHFAVTGPSTMIVLYNVADNVKGHESKVTTLTERADYSKLAALALRQGELSGDRSGAIRGGHRSRRRGGTICAGPLRRSHGEARGRGNGAMAANEVHNARPHQDSGGKQSLRPRTPAAPR